MFSFEKSYRGFIMKQMFIIGLMLILFVGLALAAPGQPHKFYGTVTVNGAPASDGTEVTATVDGVTRAQESTSEGKYGYDPWFMVVDPDAFYGIYHSEIKFYIDGYDTGESIAFVAGEHTELDLSVSYSTGGDNGGGSSGGGGGGSLGAVDLWDCEEWSECVDGEQTQDCVQGIAKKTNTRECELENLALGTTSLIPPTPPGFEEQLAEQDNELLESPGAPPITGAATAEADETDKSFVDLITGNWMVPFLLGIVVVLVALVLVLGAGKRRKRVSEVPVEPPKKPDDFEPPTAPAFDSHESSMPETPESDEHKGH